MVKRMMCAAVGVLALTAGLVVAAVAGGAGTGGQTRPAGPGVRAGTPTPPPAASREQIEDAIRTGRAKKLPPGPANVHFGGYWNGCGFVVVRSVSTSYALDGGEVGIHGPATPVDSAVPTCAVKRPATAAEINAFEEKLAELARPGRPPGLPDPPKLTARGG